MEHGRATARGDTPRTRRGGLAVLIALVVLAPAAVAAPASTAGHGTSATVSLPARLVRAIGSLLRARERVDVPLVLADGVESGPAPVFVRSAARRVSTPPLASWLLDLPPPLA